MNLDEWLSEAQKFEDVEFVGPVAAAEIERATEEIGLSLPGQYREFLSTVGCGSVASESFIGLGGDSDLDVVWMTKTLRGKVRLKPFPATFIPLRGDGFGNYDAIDTGQPTVNGECAIVEWNHEGAESDPCRVLARSYYEWLEAMLDIISAGAE